MFNTFKMLAVWIPCIVVAGAVGMPISYFRNDINDLYWIAMWITRTGLSAAHVALDIRGRELIPAAQSCIFMSNHVSYLDPPATIVAIPGRCSVLLKKEIRRVPFLGKAMSMAKFVFVERGSTAQTAQRNIAAAKAALDFGLHMLVYPEGTRAKDGRLARFKKGPFFLAFETGAPVIPVAVSNTQVLLRKGSSAVLGGTARVQFLAPLLPADFPNREALQRAVYQAIADALPAEMKPAIA